MEQITVFFRVCSMSFCSQLVPRQRWIQFARSMNYDADQNGANEEYHFPLPIIYCLSVYLKHLSRILFAMLDNIAVAQAATAAAAAIPNA